MCCSHVRMIKHVPCGPYVLSMGQTHGVPWAMVLSEMSQVGERAERVRIGQVAESEAAGD